MSDGIDALVENSKEHNLAANLKPPDSGNATVACSFMIRPDHVNLQDIMWDCIPVPQIPPNLANPCDAALNDREFKRPFFK